MFHPALLLLFSVSALMLWWLELILYEKGHLSSMPQGARTVFEWVLGTDAHKGDKRGLAFPRCNEANFQ